MPYLTDGKPLTLHDLQRMRASGEKLAALTCYDASFAALLDRCGVDLALVGDSLGNVIQGRASTLGVTMADMLYHTRCVMRGAKRPFVVVDMPFGTYQESREQALHNACALMAAGAHMVKLEGGAHMVETVRFLVERGVPVCAHIGLQPQAVHQLGGYRVQGRTEKSAGALKRDALALEQAGAALMVMEMIPAALAGEITEALQSTATIGIGAGAKCSGQVLVLYDVIGVYAGKKLRIAKDFMAGATGVDAAIKAYVSAVKDGTFPTPDHSFQ
jgi:3-methyl-2-oxobutanoate hydroxymethyltransferase